RKVAHVVPPEVSAQLQRVLPSLNGNIIHKLPLRHVAPLRKYRQKWKRSGPGPQRRQVRIIYVQDERERGQRVGQVWALEQRRIPQYRSDEVVYHRRAEDMRVVQLSFILRL